MPPGEQDAPSPPPLGSVPPGTADLYDWECLHVLRRRDQDLGFWRDVARRSERASGEHLRILELACGTGRITFPLAAALGGGTGDQDGQAGVTIVGLDKDPAMLAAAQRRRLGQLPQRRPGPLLVASDMRRFALASNFHLVFIAYNSLQLLAGLDEMVTCLGVVRRHLAPEGLVGVEVTDFQAGGADGAAGERPELLGQADGIRLWGRLVHDLAARTSRYQRRFAGDGWMVDDEVVVRSIDRIELSAILQAAGLVPIQWWENGPTLRVVASARGEPTLATPSA